MNIESSYPICISYFVPRQWHRPAVHISLRSSSSSLRAPQACKPHLSRTRRLPAMSVPYGKGMCLRQKSCSQECQVLTGEGILRRRLRKVSGLDDICEGPSFIAMLRRGGFPTGFSLAEVTAACGHVMERTVVPAIKSAVNARNFGELTLIDQRCKSSWLIMFDRQPTSTR